jgi:hypothetical protein
MFSCVRLAFGTGNICIYMRLHDAGIARYRIVLDVDF